MTSDLEEEIKRLPAGVAMLVSNEIERPITVNVRPRKSRHGGISTEIVSKEKANAPTTHATRGPEKRGGAAAGSTTEKPSREKKGPGGGFLKKVFGTRKA